MNGLNKNTLAFLSGGGEMGELTRNFDWSKTPVGASAQWPITLRNMVGIVLHSAFPQFLFWEKDLISFYNDAFLPTLRANGKHPALGKKGKEVWAELWNYIGPLIEQVMTSGNPAYFEDMVVPFFNNGKIGNQYWTFNYSPVFGDHGEIAGVFVTCTETTAKVTALKEMEATASRFRALVEEAPVGTCLFTGREMKVEIINDIMVGYWGKGHTVLGKRLDEALPELKGQPFLKLLDGVYTTGKPYAAKGALVELEVDGVKGEYYYDFTYKPVRNSSGEVFGIINVSIDATERVLAQQQLENSQKQLLSYFEQSPVAIATLSKEDLTFQLVNPFYGELVGRKPEDLENKPLLEALPELRGQGFDDLLRGVIESGKPFIAEEVAAELKRKDGLEVVYVNLTYQPQRDIKGEVVGILVVATDVTQQVTSRKRVEESEAHLQLLRNAVPAMIFYMDMEQRYRSYNNVFMEWFKVNATEALGKTALEFIGEKAYQKALPYLTKAYAGERVEYHMHAPKQIGDEKWLNIVYTPHKKADGKVIGVIVHATDITEHVLARKQIEQKEKELRELIAASPIGICVLSGMKATIEEVNDRFILISGKQAEQFVDANYWDVFPEVAETFAPVLANVFKTGVKFTVEEAELILIKKGIPETMFATFEYIPLFDLNDVVTKVMVMVVDVTYQVETRKKIEEAVIERTTALNETNLQLKRSNEELEQFAYIASHDLQEPIRKISTFMQLLEQSLVDPSEKAKGYIAKIFNSTDRMSKLVRDVLAYSRIRDESQEFETVDLNNIIEAVKVDYELPITETQATIETANLPTLSAISSQMMQLFDNLMSNALKYKRPDVKPVIKISATVAKKEKVASQISLDPHKKYYHIEFSDNGIGFSQEHVERIFRIFQRLHGKTEYEGTGIGLAICLKIVHNHGGHISAAVAENGGALFNILLPAMVVSS